MDDVVGGGYRCWSIAKGCSFRSRDSDILHGFVHTDFRDATGVARV